MHEAVTLPSTEDLMNRIRAADACELHDQEAASTFGKVEVELHQALGLAECRLMATGGDSRVGPGSQLNGYLSEEERAELVGKDPCVADDVARALLPDWKLGPVSRYRSAQCQFTMTQGDESLEFDMDFDRDAEQIGDEPAIVGGLTGVWFNQYQTRDLTEPSHPRRFQRLSDRQAGRGGPSAWRATGIRATAARLDPHLGSPPALRLGGPPAAGFSVTQLMGRPAGGPAPIWP